MVFIVRKLVSTDQEAEFEFYEGQIIGLTVPIISLCVPTKVSIRIHEREQYLLLILSSLNEQWVMIDRVTAIDVWGKMCLL